MAVRRLPEATQAILSNYCGLGVSTIPHVRVRLAGAAASLGKMPGQSGATASVYQQLAEALDQLGRFGEVGC